MDELDRMIEAAKAQAPPSRWESFGRGGLQGATFGFGDEISGLTSGALQKLANTGAGKYILQKALGMDVADADAGEAYRDTRDAERAANAAAEEAHGGLYLGGNLAGGLATGRFIPGLNAGKGAGLLKRSLVSAANAVPVGMLYGAGASNADNARDLAVDTALGGVNAALFGGAAPAVGVGISKAPSVLKRAGQAVGKYVLGGSRAGKLSDEAAELALESGAIRWGGTTAGAAERLEKDIAAQYAPQYKAILKDLAARGVEGPEATALADQWLSRAVQEEGRTVASTVPDLYMRHAEDIATKGGQSGRVGLERMADIVGDLQGRAKWDRNVDTATNVARKTLSRDARLALEDAVERQVSQSDLATQEVGAKFIPAKRTLAKAIEASEAAERAAKGSHTLKDLALELGAGVAGHGALSHGRLGPLAGPVVSGLTYLGRTRGPSTLARALYGSGKLSQSAGELAAPYAARVLSGQGASGALAGELLPQRLPPLPAIAEEGDELDQMIANARRANAAQARK